MRTRRELLIATKAFTAENLRKSWWHVCSTFALLGLLLGFVCADVPLALRIPVSLLIGLVVVRLFVLYHDHQHGAILRGSRLADLLMRAWGLIILSPSSGWKRSHNHHHAHNSKLPGPNIGSFPLMDVEAYRNASRYEKFLYVAERHPLTILVGYFTVFFVGMCILPFLSNPKRHFDAMLSIVCHVGLCVWFGYYGIDNLILAMLIPCTVASAIGAYMFYAQHNYPGARVYRQSNWGYVAAALDSSSYIKTGPILGWFTGNIGYHHIHHLNDRIPFYRLPETMECLEELQSVVTISLSPKDIRACFRQNLWDTAAESLVSWSALDKKPAANVDVEPHTERRAA